MICTGIDVPAATALADPSGRLDPGLLTACLTAIEAGRLSGQARQSSE